MLWVYNVKDNIKNTTIVIDKYDFNFKYLNGLIWFKLRYDLFHKSYLIKTHPNTRSQNPCVPNKEIITLLAKLHAPLK